MKCPYCDAERVYDKDMEKLYCKKCGRLET